MLPRSATLSALVLYWIVGTPGPVLAGAANVDAACIVKADQDPANWLTYGRTYSEQRFSPLKRINADDAGQLGLAWYADLDTERGHRYPSQRRSVQRRRSQGTAPRMQPNPREWPVSTPDA
jgi:glucose dehydrogenase